MQYFWLSDANRIRILALENTDIELGDRGEIKVNAHLQQLCRIFMLQVMLKRTSIYVYIFR